MDYFAVGYLSVEKLLREWHWLCPEDVTLVARNAFGDLFLCDSQRKIIWLDVAIGKLSVVAESFEQFQSLAESQDNRQQWFAANDEQQAANRGLVPGVEQCIGFATPLVFNESGYAENPYIADLYEYVSFLGDLHRKIAELPEGAKVKLVIKE